MNSPRETNVNVRPPRRRSAGPLAAAALAALALVALVAVAALGPRDPSPSTIVLPSATPTEAGETVAGNTASPAPTQTPAATAAGDAGTYESPLGYSVELPEGWRHSDLQSHDEPVPNGDPENLASDRFTSRSPEDERDAVGRSVDMTGPGPALSYTAFVQIYRNSERQTTREFAEDAGTGFGQPVESIEEIQLGDKRATRVTWRWAQQGTAFATYVEDDQGRMWVIGFYLGDGGPVPEGATRDDLVKIVESFDADWLRD